MDPLKIIEKYYADNPEAKRLLITHSRLVTDKAVGIGKRFKEADVEFIKEAGMLHDIGIIRTDDPGLHCYGDKPYLAHLYLGREILEREGLGKHALVAERHAGVGITKEEIANADLPLPHRDMVPETLEEKIIAYADNFYRKIGDDITKPKTVEDIQDELGKYSDQHVEKFDKWHEKFSGESSTTTK